MWASNNQGCVALSTSEAEYVDLSNCIKEAKLISGLLEELACKLGNTVTVFEYNNDAMK